MLQVLFCTCALTTLTWSLQSQEPGEMAATAAANADHCRVLLPAMELRHANRCVRQRGSLSVRGGRGERCGWNGMKCVCSHCDVMPLSLNVCAVVCRRLRRRAGVAGSPLEAPLHTSGRSRRQAIQQHQRRILTSRMRTRARLMNVATVSCCDLLLTEGCRCF